MRAILVQLLLLSSPAMAGADQSHKYVAEIAHDSDTEWVGVADLKDQADGHVRGEFCLVRKEYTVRPALPRTLLRVPFVGRRNGNSLN